MKADVKTMLLLRNTKIYINDKEMSVLDYIETLENTTKEVREYIISHREPVDERNSETLYWLTDDFDEEDILEILDKGVIKNE